MNPKANLRLKGPYIDRLCSKVAVLFNRIPIDHPVEYDIKTWLSKKLSEV